MSSWEQLIWNINFAQQLIAGSIFFILAVVAAIFLIPYFLKRIQAQRERAIVKILLIRWCGGCIGAIGRLQPIASHIEIEKYRGIKGDPITLYWKDIHEGRVSPKGCGMVISKSVEKAVYTEEEFKWKEIPPEQTWPFNEGDPDVPRSWLRGILNAIYSKLDIFDLNMLPIQEIEMSLSILDSMSQNGYVSRTKYADFSHHLAQAFEKFAIYLWEIENWSVNN